MSSYLKTGRTKQKARTRAALVAAARELLAQGANLTVESTAERAGISRTTAYRYFPDRFALLAATYPEIKSTSLLGPNPPADPLERLELVTERIGRRLLENEPELRAQLRLSLEPSLHPREDLPLRQGRAIEWIEEALAPLAERVGKAKVRRLAIAVRATLGIEPLVWLIDVAGVSREDALEIMRRSARAVAVAAIADLNR